LKSHSHKRPSCNSLDGWVASGVDFSEFVETETVDPSQVYCDGRSEEVAGVACQKKFSQASFNTYVPARKLKNVRRSCASPIEDAGTALDVPLWNSLCSALDHEEVPSLSISSHSEGGGGKILRRKSQPRHKCASVNQSITSIMRPSRYSSPNLASLLVKEDIDVFTTTSSSTTNEPQLYPMRRHASLPSMAAFMPPQLKSHSHKRPSCNSLDGWVASGVDFSEFVEVHVFRK